MTRLKQGGRPDTALARGLRRLGRFAMRNGKLITAATVVFLAVSIA